MFTDQFEEHLASQPDESRWDGFDRGDFKEIYGETVIGRMTNSAGQRVVIVEELANSDVFHRVEVDGNVVFFEEDARARAIGYARWLMNQA